MKYNSLVTAIVFGLALSFTPGSAGAQPATEDHLSEAISHTREAVVAGREGKPDQLVMHATTALEHAKAEQTEQPRNVHVKKAVKRLTDAIRYGKAKRRAATIVANYALQELERAPKK